MTIAAIFALIQSTIPTSMPIPSMPDIVSTGIAGTVLYLWRQDRADRAAERDAQDRRYQLLAEDFRRIVTENTAAITSLRNSIVNLPGPVALHAPRKGN